MRSWFSLEGILTWEAAVILLCLSLRLSLFRLNLFQESSLKIWALALKTIKGHIGLLIVSVAGPCKMEFKFKLEKQRIIQLDLLLLWDLLCSYLIVFLTKSHKIGDKKWVVSATCHCNQFGIRTGMIGVWRLKGLLSWDSFANKICLNDDQIINLATGCTPSMLCLFEAACQTLVVTAKAG